MSTKDRFEGLPPVANNPPGDSRMGKLLFFLRGVLDMQVASVCRHLRPWLAGLSGTLLEVGCGAQPYRHLVPSECIYTGLDWEQAEEHFAYRLPDTVYYQGEGFPFAEGSFDHVFHTEVLEHVYHPGRFLAECHRVLKPAGTMFLTVPFQARYHYIPHDYFRYTPAALERMLREAGFREISIRPRGSDLTVAAYKNFSVFYRWLRSGPAGLLAGVLLSPLGALALLVGIVTLRLPLGSPDDCLGYTVTARARRQGEV
jgi:SAM-dependent methyltransferase